MRQEARHVGALQGYAAFGRRKTRARQMEENRTPTTAFARADIPIHDDTDVINIVTAPHLLVARLKRQFDGAVIIGVIGRIAPAIAFTHAP